MITKVIIPTVYNTVAEAQAVAAFLAVMEEDGWTYTVTPDPLNPDTDMSLVMVADETGHVIGPL